MIFEQKNNPLESGEVKISIPMVTQREKKIKCQNCGRELDPEETLQRLEAVDLEGSFRPYSICGYCKSDELTEATRCRGCTHLIVDYEDETEGYCTACACDIAERFRVLVAEKFDSGELEVLYSLFGLDITRD